MSKAWPIVRLGEVMRRSGETIELLPDAEYREITVRLWGRGVVERGRALGAEIGGSRRFVARTNQFIASRIDARNGAMGLVPSELDGAVVSNDFPLFEVAGDRLLSEFLGWLSRTRHFIELCIRASEGTTNRVRLKEERFLTLEVSLPPLAEQRRFVARIQELEHEVAHAARLRDAAAAEAQLLWRRMAATKLERLARSTPHRRIGEIASVRGGGTPPKSNPVLWEGSIPWISPKDMKVRELHDAQDHISVLATRVTAAKLIDPGAVLIVVRGMILAHTVPSAVLRVPAAVNQDMKALVPTAALLPEYLCSYLWATNDRLLGLVDRSTHDTRKLETDKLLAVEIALPSVSEQRRVVTELSALQIDVVELTTRQKQVTAALASLIPSVLNQMFSENSDGRRFC